MTEPRPLQILTVNSGSSSLKLALYTAGKGVEAVASMEAERIGERDLRLRAGKAGEKAEELPRPASVGSAPGFGDIFQALLDWLEKDCPERQSPALRIDSVGHRIVHGGPRYRSAQLLNEEVLAELRRLTAVDPGHMPQALECISAASRRFPRAPQAVCFDTAFHRTMPAVAQRFALPRRFHDEGILLYGFHGISYEYIVSELARIEPERAMGRVIVAHLGNGASMAAISGGKSVETSMGFTPVAGLMMGTRCGDLDPGLLAWLAQQRKMSGEEMTRRVARESGLLGVSGSSQAMRDLLAREAADAAAAEAVALFCYRARQYVGALAAVLGGLDILVFTGGVGEHAAPVRERICSGLEFLGVGIDGERNRAGAPLISREADRVAVRVIAANEDLMIARHTARIVAARSVAAGRDAAAPKSGEGSEREKIEP